METGNQYGIAENMSIDCFHDGRACVRRLLWRGLRHIHFRVHSKQLKCVVMIRARGSAGAHVAVGTQADLTRTIR